MTPSEVEQRIPMVSESLRRGESPTVRKVPKTAYRRAFHARDPWRDGLTEEDRNELADLQAFRRR